MLLFKMKERSEGCTSCCIRQCCGKFRPFMLDITPSEALVPGAKANQEAIVCDRPYKCTTLCLCRPVIRISHPATGDLCEVVNTCGCESMFYWPFTVRKPTWEGAKPMDGLGAMPEVWYYLRGYMCQAGALCTCPSGPCKRVEIKIYEDAACENQVGMLAKVWSGCFKELLTDADSFVLEFPPNALPLQKSALMAATVLCDFILFENNEKRSGGGGGFSA